MASRFELPGDGLVAARVCLSQRMPAGDPVRLRSVGRQSGARAADLRRAASTLLSSADTALWSGTAHQAFVEEIRVHAPSMSATADRYDHYASALNTYACALDQAVPTLGAVRSRLRRCYDELAGREHAGADLRYGGFGADSVGSGMPGGQRSPHSAGLLLIAREFKAAYDQWVDALNRCIQALSQADQADPTRDLHGFSALGHRVAGAARTYLTPFEKAVLHPSLRNVSDCLGALNVSLTVVGIGLFFICPAAGAACLAAATVLGVAQLAVDTTRRQRGEQVSNGSLGLEMAAAIPVGGGAFRGLRAAEEATRLVPGGGLMAHEGLDGGHTLAKHVGKSEDFLRNRLATEPHIDAASTFYNREVAEESLSTILYENESRIATWLSGSTKELILAGRAAEPVGVMAFRESSTAHEANGIRLVLRRSPRLVIGYRIHTAMVMM